MQRETIRVQGVNDDRVQLPPDRNPVAKSNGRDKEELQHIDHASSRESVLAAIVRSFSAHSKNEIFLLKQS